MILGWNMTYVLKHAYFLYANHNFILKYDPSLKIGFILNIKNVLLLMTNVIWFVFSLNCRSLWMLSSFWLFLDPLSCTYNEIYGWLSVQADAVCERAHGSDLRRCAEGRVSQRRDLLPDHQTNDWKPRQVRFSFTFIARHCDFLQCMLLFQSFAQ